MRFEKRSQPTSSNFKAGRVTPCAPFNIQICHDRAHGVRLSQNSAFFFLSPRGTSGERTEERGILNKNAPPLPGPLLHPMEEREKNR